jgi:hypothetical protein
MTHKPDEAVEGGRERLLLRLVIVMASNFQGGHSPIGREVAGLLGIPFPLNMTNLSKAARDNGFDPDRLWPWLKSMRGTEAE